MVVPAFLMGLAFPMAGRVYAEYREKVGSAVGEVLAYNTLGAILGAAASGFAMIYLFGIERALQMLIVINIGFGLLVLASLARTRALLAGASAATAAVLLFLGINDSAVRLWDQKNFAIYRNNVPEAYRTSEMIREAAENYDVLYYAEGAEAIVSSIKVKGGEQSFITNGRVEASSHLQAQQCQFTLGHLPMLLNRNPKQVLVVGTGSGMTLGSTAIHPEVERVTLAELEPKVMGVARTFEEYNHRVLDNPKLRVVFNDGRNFLMTTNQKFDVITADPIHPWFRGAGYLYTSEYFKLAADHLNPGGMVCQWLPIYELTTDNLRSVVRTFQEQFPHTMLWITHGDAELIGSNAPIMIDEAELERRINQPKIGDDLKRVMMGSARDFLSYFVMGTEGMKQFARGAIVNTDDNLYLEFSAPFSIGRHAAMGENFARITRYQETIIPYLVPAATAAGRADQVKYWTRLRSASGIWGPAVALYLMGEHDTPDFKRMMHRLDTEYAWYAPGRFLKKEYEETVVALEPTLIRKTSLLLSTGNRGTVTREIAAVLAPVSRDVAYVSFVDNQERIVYGQKQFWGYRSNQAMQDFVHDVMTTIDSAYRQETARNGAGNPPSEGLMLPEIRELIARKTQSVR
jgi:spermidine synthase